MFGKTENSTPFIPGFDPMIGQSGGGIARDTGGIDPNNATRRLSVPQFIKPRGGEYFFSPSIPALTDIISA